MTGMSDFHDRAPYPSRTTAAIGFNGPQTNLPGRSVYNSRDLVDKRAVTDSVATETPQCVWTSTDSASVTADGILLDSARLIKLSDPRTGVVPGITQDRNMR